jgi:hypothetical protein
LRWLLLRLWTFEFLCTPFSFPPLYFSLSLFLHFFLLLFFSSEFYSPFILFIQHCPYFYFLFFLSPFLHSPSMKKPPLSIFKYYPFFYCGYPDQFTRISTNLSMS